MKNPLVKRGFFSIIGKVSDSAQTDNVQILFGIINVTLSGVEVFPIFSIYSKQSS